MSVVDVLLDAGWVVGMVGCVFPPAWLTYLAVRVQNEWDYLVAMYRSR